MTTMTRLSTTATELLETNCSEV